MLFEMESAWIEYEHDSSEDEYPIVYVTYKDTGYPYTPLGDTYGIIGFNLQYPISKKIWLMCFFGRVHHGWLRNYRHIVKIIFAFCRVDEGTFDPNLICY